MAGGALFSPGFAVAKEGEHAAVDCVDYADPVNRTETADMAARLSANAGRWNPDYAFSIGATEALGRLFEGQGRAVHPEGTGTHDLRRAELFRREAASG